MSNLHIVCTACDAVNRRRDDPDLGSCRCSNCRHPMFTGQPTELDEDRFWHHLERSELPIAASFGASGSTCDAAFAQLAARLEPAARFVTVAADRAPRIALRFGIDRLPACAVFAKGRLVARQTGVEDREEMQRWMDDLLAEREAGSKVASIA